MEKVNVSKEVAEAIEHAEELQKEHERIIEFHCSTVDWTGLCKPLNYITTDTLIRALYIGYEVEQTPEDKVRELYDYFDQPEISFAGIDVRNKIARMFTFLEIPVKGVNCQ